MDREGATLPSSTLLSLTGYLDLYQKTWRGRQKKRYWFWFDEQTCQLKYYRSQEAYQHGVFDPLMTVDLRYAAVTPPMAGEELLANQFQINTGGQTYILAAPDAEKAHSWIKKLQEKREQWIRRQSAQGQTDLDRQAKKKILQPNSRPGVLLSSSEESKGQDKEQSSTVRKILQRHIKLENRHSSPLESAGSYPSSVIPSNTAISDASSADGLEGPERREVLELRHAFHASQEEVTRQQKEVLLLKDRMEKKNEKIVQLNSDIDDLRESLAKIKSGKSPDNYELEIESLQDIIGQYKRSVQSLVDEVELKRLQEEEYERRVNAERVKVQELEREVNKFKAKFVTLLSDKFKVLVPTGPEEERKEDKDEPLYQDELLQLLQRESDGNVMFQYKSSFKDEYGDWHDWHSDTTVQHYLCRQLYLHYTQPEVEMLVQEWADFLKPIKHMKGKTYLDLLPGNERIKRRELRNLLRRGVPIQYRTRIWSSLVYRLVGKVKEVKDNAVGADNTYYTSLLLSKADTTSEKQILLDLHRTLPSNAHFRSKGYGAQKLKNVLLAYSRHNKNIGYCQGMNLIAAIGLLFLDEEATFWFLYVVIEKLLPLDYFSPGLFGAQADQAVLRELLPQKLPRLSAHLDLHSIDVTLITFNWFLTLFIDAMPTESALRILDCFLMEGTKVLFRVGLGVLKVNARHLLSITDPVALFQTLKEIAKHTFNIDQLLQVAFTGIEPFPSRNVLTARHSYHYSKIKEQWLLREKELKEREVRSKLEKLQKKPPLRSLLLERSFRETQKARRHLVWECGCVRQTGDEEPDEEVWLCCGDRHQGRIAIISNINGRWQTTVPSYNVSSRVISACYVQSDLVVLGTLDFNVYVFHCKSERKAWSMKMPDSVLAIQSTDDCAVFAALADGFVAILQNVGVEPPERGPLLVHIGSGAVTCLALYSEQQVLWCGCGNAITILSLQSFEPIHSIAMEELKVYKMVTSDYGVWVSFRSSSVVSLYDARRHVKLLQVDYTSVLPSTVPFLDELDSRITSMMVAKDELWLGTGKGVVLIFAVSEAVPETEAAIAELEQSSSEPAAHSGEPGTVGRGLLTPQLPVGSDDAFSIVGTSRYRSRRAAFGRTLRGPSKKLVPKKGPAVFQLQFQSSHQIVHAESVRVLLSIGGGSTVVSCVHSVTDSDKGVQGWTGQTTPRKWNFQYLSLSLGNIRDVGRELDKRLSVNGTPETHSYGSSVQVEWPEDSQESEAKDISVL